MTIGKIRITQEQADAIENYLKTRDVSELIDDHAEVCRNNKWAAEIYKPLNDLSQADLARALLIGYEVELEYKSGDWVVDKQTKKIHQVIYVNFDSVGVNGMIIGNLLIRHATTEEIKAEKERRVWKEIGRDVNEVKAGDCIASQGEYFKVFDNMGCKKWANHISPGLAETFFLDGVVNGFYPAESFVSFEEGDEL